MTRIQRAAYALIVFVLGTGFLSALYMVFVVHHVPGHAGPMLEGAHGVSPEFFLRRRLYALEAWITFGFLSIFLALTWFRPKSP
jgi:hypothetical protein